VEFPAGEKDSTPLSDSFDVLLFPAPFFTDGKHRIGLVSVWGCSDWLGQILTATFGR